MIAYHASHEQFAPSELLKLVQMAERAGFDAIHSSEHFQPWSERQGQSGHAFSWIAAAMQVCSLPFSMVCAPGPRHHPAIVAQALATINELYPGRLDVELGSGEALNESIIGEEWPEKNFRNERLLQSYRIINDLLSGKTISFNGYVNVRNARLYTLPRQKPKLFCAALSKETSEWAGSWADGLLTTGGDVDQVIEKRDAFFNNGGAGKPFYVQFAFSFAQDRKQAIEGAFDQWRSNLVAAEKLSNLDSPADFDREAQSISIKEVEEKVPLYTDIEQVRDKAEEYFKAGADRVILHNVNREQQYFIKSYEKILAK
jgi:probable non-F420 flavinoid oxidoreductase